jgi:hypothetical protein
MLALRELVIVVAFAIRGVDGDFQLFICAVAIM